MFNNRYTDIDYAEREGRLSIATNSKTVASVNEFTLSNWCIAIGEISKELHISLRSKHTIIAYHLNSHKICALWVLVYKWKNIKRSVLKVLLNFSNVTKISFWTKLWPKMSFGFTPFYLSTLESKHFTFPTRKKNFVLIHLPERWCWFFYFYFYFIFFDRERL